MTLDPKALAERITNYLASGGLFNPELANHEAVRELLIDCRAALRTGAEPVAVTDEPWRDMKTAPRDGTPILACRNNGCGWDHFVVWWGGRMPYPWQSENNAYPEDRLDYWQALSAPYDVGVDMWPAALTAALGGDRG